MMLFNPFGARLVSHDFPLWMNLSRISGKKRRVPHRFLQSLVRRQLDLGRFLHVRIGERDHGAAGRRDRAGTFAMTHSYALARAMQNWGQFNFLRESPYFPGVWSARAARERRGFHLGGAALAWAAACHYYFLIFRFWSGWVSRSMILPLIPFTSLAACAKEDQAWLLGLAGIAARCRLLGIAAPSTVIS